MKYYESTFDEYISSCEKENLHDYLELELPEHIEDVENMIFYGPPGIGKYSQVLKQIKKYSSTHLKYQKKMTLSTDKQDYIYNISDIHYEIDMALLGCNSKTLWHEIFLQIVDIISIKENKCGFIVCKNFHETHNELLEVFYSYVQHHSNINEIIHLKFILITESISFLPNNILNSFFVVKLKRPNSYERVIEQNQQFRENMDFIETNDIMNIKELHVLTKIKINQLPSDLFITVCDSIIDEMTNNKDLFKLREKIYDIMVYNLNVIECVYYVLCHFIESKRIKDNKINAIMKKMYTILLQYNNNYRPIYHLETIFVYMITQLS